MVDICFDNSVKWCIDNSINYAKTIYQDYQSKMKLRVEELEYESTTIHMFRSISCIDIKVITYIKKEHKSRIYKTIILHFFPLLLQCRAEIYDSYFNEEFKSELIKPLYIDYYLMTVPLKDFETTIISPHIYDQLADRLVPEIKVVYYKHPKTIVWWADGTKTEVTCQAMEVYDKEKGLAMAISKKALGNTSSYYNEFKKYNMRYLINYLDYIFKIKGKDRK